MKTLRYKLVFYAIIGMVLMMLMALLTSCEEQEEQCWLCTMYMVNDVGLNKSVSTSVYCDKKPKAFDTKDGKYFFNCTEINQ